MSSITKTIIAFSDTHGYIPNITSPADIIIVAGDVFPTNIDRDIEKSQDWFKFNFCPWVASLDCERFILVPGNHDFALQDYSFVKEYISLMEDTGTISKDKFVFLSAPDYNATEVTEGQTGYYEYEGIRFYGDPHTPNLSTFAFYTAHPNDQFKTIPECDILITHMPPRVGGVGTSYPMGSYRRVFGSKELESAVSKLESVKLWFCGHIHSGIHEPVKLSKTTTIYNVAIMGETYRPIYKPLVVHYTYDKEEDSAEIV